MPRQMKKAPMGAFVLNLILWREILDHALALMCALLSQWGSSHTSR